MPLAILTIMVSPEVTFAQKAAETKAAGGDGKVPMGPSIREVSEGLAASKTDVQRDAFWPSVKGKDVHWVLTVDEVTTGWFSGFKIRGLITPTFQVSCELEGNPEVKNLVGQINKGDKITCDGKLSDTYLLLLGLRTTAIDATGIRR